VSEEAGFEGLITVDGNTETFASTGLGKDVMATIDTFEFPTVSGSGANKMLSGNLLHT
jgi:hypothetical protein